MDSYERFVRVLEFEEPDRTPIFDSINSYKIIRAIGGEGPSRDTLPKVYRSFGMDISFQGLDYIPQDLPETERAERIWESNEWGNLVFSGPFRYKQILANDGGHSDTFIERPFKSIEDLLDMKVEPNMSEHDLTERYVDLYVDRKEAYGKYGIVTIGCGSAILDDVPRLLGWHLFARAIYQAKSVITRIMDLRAIEARANAKAYVEARAGPAFMVADDVAEKHGLMHSPAFLREEWLPRVKEIIQPAIKEGIKLLYHSEGNTEAILKDLINTGFCGLNPLEPFSMNLERMKERFGDKMVLTGGIDNAYLLQHGTPIDVEQATRECISVAAPGSGYCPGSSGELNPKTPLRNAISLYKTIRKYGAYPIDR